MSEITVQTWGVRFSGRRLASIPGHKGASGIDTITISYTGFLKLSGATFEDPEGGELRKYFDGNYTFNILITADNFNLIFENPVGLTYFEVPFESDNKYLINLRQFSHLARVFGGPGLSVKGRNNALEYLVYFGQDGDYAREGLSFKTGWYFKADGDGTGVATMRLTASEATELQADGNVLFCDADGSNETNTKNLLAGDNVVYFKCEYEDGYIYLQNDKITKFGTETLSLFDLPANAPIPFIQTAEFNLDSVRIITTSELNLFGGPRDDTNYFYLDSLNIYWAYEAALPIGITAWYLEGSNISWLYEGAIQKGITGWYFKADGDGTGIATMRLTASEATELQADGNVLFCDAEGLNETTTVSLVAGDNVIYFKCENEDGYIYLQNDKITKLGTESLNLFELPVNAPIPYVQIGEIYNLLTIRIFNIKTYLFGAPPSGVTNWVLSGSNIFWTYTGAPPSGVTNWYLIGSNIFWTYTGAPPSGVTYWLLNGNNIFWTYTGAPPSGVTYWYLSGSNIFWTYEGAPPSGVTYWNLYGSNIFWTYEGAPPSGVTTWRLDGSNINNINTNFSGNSNYAAFNISNWRLEKIGDTELIEILNSLKNRVGALPSTITIGDYLNYANPPQEVVDTVEALKIAKNITTVTLSI